MLKALIIITTLVAQSSLAYSGEAIPESIMQEVLALQEQSEALIAEGKSDAQSSLNLSNSQGSKANTLYVFVSFSVPKQNLMQLAKELKKLNSQGEYTGQLVLRGFYQGSYRKTASYLKNIIDNSGVGMIVDPTLFKKYAVKMIPSFVLTGKESICPSNVTCMPGTFDKLNGNVSISYALSEIKAKGEV